MFPCTELNHTHLPIHPFITNLQPTIPEIVMADLNAYGTILKDASLKGAFPSGKVILHISSDNPTDSSHSFLSTVYRLFREKAARFDAAFSFPVAEAYVPPATIQKIRDAIGGIQNVATSEDMIKRIIEDKSGTDIEPGVVKAIKDLLNILAAVSNPSDFYANLVQNGFEDIAVNKLKQLASLKEQYDRQMNQYLAKDRKESEINELRNNRQQLINKIPKLNDEIQGKVVTHQQLKLLLNEKLEQYTSAYNERTRLKKWADDATDSLKKRKKEINEYNVWAQNNRKHLSKSELRDVVKYNKEYTDFASETGTKMQQAITMIESNSNHIESLLAKITSLKVEIEIAEQERELFFQARNGVETEIQNLNSRISRLREEL